MKFLTGFLEIDIYMLFLISFGYNISFKMAPKTVLNYYKNYLTMNLDSSSFVKLF